MRNPFIVLAVGAVLLTGCSAPAPVPSPDAPAAPSPTVVSPTIEPTPVPSVTPSALPVLAARETSHEGTPLTIAVNSLHSGAGSTTLNFTITNRGTQPWKHWTALSAALSGRDNLSVSGVFLVDTVHGRRFLPARDSQGACVCSSLGGQEIGVGQSIALSAVFAPVTVDVGTAAVHIPLAGTFDEIPVSR